MSSDDRLWDRWDEVDALLARALDLPRAEQVPFVRAECGDDTELAQLVVGLLEVYASEREPLSPSDSVLRVAFSDPPDAAAGPLVGSLAGPYRLVELIGRGGMGLVFRGERADGAFEREVAVKVFHRDPAVEWLADRFALERQILATLNHPGIAQMLDGGVTAEGRPFLVMELVDGVPIDRHARERRLGVDDKVRLVREVGEAVEHAHRHLVVHRDLKPSNILVTVDGPVKLLDFGIAKLLSPDPLEASDSVTRADRRFATPEYAAPEQLLGEPVSTLTDVYSLAALLYELLTGVRPYERREGESVLERMIRGDEPTAPSTAVAASDTDGELSRSLGGDLDAILLRALQTRPESRYPSMGAFLDDLTRYLEGRPVVARGDARWYRARRFARRHRAPLAAAAGAVLLLAGSAAGLALQRAAVVAERDRAEAAAERAQQESRTAREVTAFLVDLFEASDPAAQRGDTLTVRALLQRGVERVDRDLADEPLVRSELLLALSDVNLRVGDTDEADRLAGRAVDLRRDSTEAPDSAVVVALLRRANVQRRQRFWARSIASLRGALDLLASPPEMTLAADVHMQLGDVYKNLEQLDSAEFHLRRAMEFNDRLGWDNMGTRGSLAGVLRRRGDLDGAADLYRQVVDQGRQTGSRGPSAFALSLNDLAVTLRMSGEYEAAADAYREALDSLELVYGAGHPTSLMVSGNYGRVAEERGRLDDALRIYSERTQAARARWPEGHWQLADVLMSHGAALVKYDRAEEAIPILNEALDVGMEQLGAYHIWNAVYRGWLATAARLTSRDAPADQLFGWSVEGVGSYDRFDTDDAALGRLRALVDVMEDKGLEADAARYHALVDLRP